MDQNTNTKSEFIQKMNELYNKMNGNQRHMIDLLPSLLTSINDNNGDISRLEKTAYVTDKLLKLSEELNQLDMIAKSSKPLAECLDNIME